MRVELPEGNWADLRDPDDLFDADRKAVAGQIVIEVNPDTKVRVMRGDMDDKVADALLARVVDAWSYTHLRLPSKDPESLGRMKISHARALRDALEPHMKIISGTSDDDENPTISES
jgi:hypothetical protein